MPRLKDRNKSPINGYQHTEAQTGWSKQWWDFGTAVREIRAHRLANPRFNLSTDIQQIGNELDTENALRCLSINGGGSFVIADQSPPPKYQALAPRPQPVAGAVGKLAAGVETLSQWLGKGGKPVAKELSDKRANICVDCPQNGKEGLAHYFTAPAVALIKKMIEHRNSLKLYTSVDDKLGTCKACMCDLRLKCHTPLEDIVDHMSDEVKGALDPRCWILHNDE